MSAGVIIKILLLVLIVMAMSVSGCAYINNRIMAYNINKSLYGNLLGK